MKRRVIIMGAAGRDFHNFNAFFRNNSNYNVVAFTQASEQNIGALSKLPQRKYPKELSGKFYPKGIPIYSEEKLLALIRKLKVDEAVLAYSDLSFQYVMEKASQVLAAGADFKLMGLNSTMLKSKKPFISICAVRTGCGKSQTTRKVAKLLKERGYKAVVIRHPMPYGNLRKQILQRFEKYEDLNRYNCTIEEREEYEPHIENGNIVYAGVDYEKILRKAEKEADVIIWDGGNNDFPFYKTDLHIVLVDPLRPGHEILYYPGMTNLLMADVIVVAKEKSATKENIERVKKNVRTFNKKAIIIDATSEIKVEKHELIHDKRILVVEDGPTLTHGGTRFGAGYIAAKNHGAKEIVDPRPYAVGSLKKIYAEYKQLKEILPAMGYNKVEIDELQKTINHARCDSVIVGTPIRLDRILRVNKPIVRVHYELKEIGKPDLETIISKFEKEFL
ncbi:TPA: GTPase [archaeon]|uniref:GTPase n=1 Tax=Candidatus Naiadarchaeum limnaeum TaxID=2756139 RepID=A0A832XGP0_9ARCH|nr:GTPase [Candidatus Naiadarchaeales archaeon SRR2090153.bin1042]HIK00414.1 GTPase [Candidatus Naiadarchaeum limnaeum]